MCDYMHQRSQGILMDFLNHREGGMVLYRVFLLSPLQLRGCVNLKKYISEGKAVEVTVNSKEENSLRLFSGFRPSN